MLKNISADMEVPMKMVFKLWLMALIILCSVLLINSYAEGPAGPMAGVEVTVNEYGNLNGIDLKVLNWGVITELPSKMFGLPFKKDKYDLVQVDVMFKNAEKRPILLASSFLKGTLIGNNEEAFESDSSFFKEYRNLKKSFKHKLLPGQPVNGSFFFAVDKEIIPVKLVIRESGGDKVIRFFLQRNLPNELIPGTSRR
jgi:hypothetical protein